MCHAVYVKDTRCETRSQLIAALSLLRESRSVVAAFDVSIALLEGEEPPTDDECLCWFGPSRCKGVAKQLGLYGADEPTFGDTYLSDEAIDDPTLRHWSATPSASPVRLDDTAAGETR